MNKAFLLLFVLLAVGLVGQTAASGGSTIPSGQTSRTHRGAVPGGERSMKGCLIKDESGAYILQTQRNAKVKLDSAEDLGSRLGRQIRVTGAFEDAQSGGNDAAPTGPAHSNSNAHETLHSVHAFRVFRVDVLSQTCTPRKK